MFHYSILFPMSHTIKTCYKLNMKYMSMIHYHSRLLQAKWHSSGIGFSYHIKKSLIITLEYVLVMHVCFHIITCHTHYFTSGY